MIQIPTILKKWARRTLGPIPAPLPKGATEFTTFCTKLLNTYNLPDEPSYHHAIASMVMNLPPYKDKHSPLAFAKAVRKAMANQTAYDAIQRIREEEKKKASSSDEPLPV